MERRAREALSLRLNSCESRRRRLPHPSPLPEGYGIHTSFGACAEAFDLNPYSGDSHAGGGYGADARGVRGRTPEKGGTFLCERLVAHGGKGVSVSRLGGDRAGEMRIARFLHNPKV